MSAPNKVKRLLTFPRSAASCGSAKQGDAHAQTLLGVMYANAEGVMHDDIVAYVWSNVAATNGNERAFKNAQT